MKTNCLLQYNRHYFSCIARANLVRNLLFRLFCFNRIAKKSPTKPALDRIVKVTCGNCGTSITKLNLSRHKLRCSGGVLYCPKCPNFSTKSRDDLSYHITKEHATPRVKITHKYKVCPKEFSEFFALGQHKTNEHGFQTKSAEFDVNKFLEEEDADLNE